nr:LysR family transcriptional regulator [Litorivivens lipolytica]
MRQIEIFLAVCRLRNYSRAADELALTQPAVSAQIRQVENVVGEALFDYIGKQLNITPAGLLLERAARDLQQRLVSLEMELAELKGEVQGTLNIAAESSAQYFLPGLLSTFSERNPGVDIRLDIDNRARTLKRLNEGRHELVITGAPPPDRTLQFTPFRDNPLIAVARADHPLSNNESISFFELTQERLLLRESGSGTRLAVEEFAQIKAVKLTHVYQLGSLEAIKAGVMEGLGVSILPLDACTQEIEHGLLRSLPVDGFPLKRSWCVVHFRKRQLTPVSQRFTQFLLDPD